MGNRSKRGSDFVSFLCELNKHNNVLFVLFTFIDRFMSQEHTLQLQGRAKQHLTFTSLINHLGHLVIGPSSIADVTKKELQSRFVERESLIKSVESRKSSDTLDLNIWEDISAFLPIWYRPRRYFLWGKKLKLLVVFLWLMISACSLHHWRYLRMATCL